MASKVQDASDLLPEVRPTPIPLLGLRGETIMGECRSKENPALIPEMAPQIVMRCRQQARISQFGCPLDEHLHHFTKINELGILQ